jgi:hypothetical protein
MFKNILLALGLLIVGAAFGRFTAPSKVVEKEVIKYQDKIVEKVVYVKDTSEKKHQVTTTTVTTKPDGTKVETTVITFDDNTDTTQKNSDNKTDTSETDTTKEKTTTYAKDQYLVSISQKLNISDKNMSFGGSFNKRVLGPIYVGAFGFTDGTIGASIGLSF